MEIQEAQAAIEALLFASGDPVPAARIAQVLSIDAATVEKLVGALSERMKGEGSGLEVLKLDQSYQLCTKKKYAGIVRAAMEIRRNAPLSQAALEILAIIAYNQPVTKGFVEQIRGVDSSGAIASLSSKGLIEEKGRLELPGRPLLYGTTEHFLRCFQLSSLEQLPPLPQKSGEPEPAEEEENGQAQEDAFGEPTL